MGSRVSAGLALYRCGPSAGLEVFLVHPGGPLFARKDEGYWTIPKGEVEPGDDLLATACREFSEETGLPVPSGRSFLSLTWLTFGQACSLIALPIFHGSSTDLERWTVGLAEAPSTTVDPAEMREFIPLSGTYRPDHGASRGASSL